MGDRDQPNEHEPTAFSNGVRLTGREWLFVAVFAALLFAFAPSLWKRAEPFLLEPDYRIPHDLSNDYWLYERYVDLASERYDTVVIGDSVIWGEYVLGSETLSHYLNEIDGRERCANLGLDGAHPLALGGLVEYYTGRVQGKNVLLQCNPLWLSSPKADLRDEQVTDFNHPWLVPQFAPRIPGYKEPVSPRIGVVVERHSATTSWTTHLQQAYYDRSDIPSWTLEHPYDDPLKPLTHGLPPADHSRRHDPKRPWFKNGITRQAFPWVDLDTSLQWHAFRDVVQTLRRRGNRVFVLVGPFNEHLLNPESRRRYQQVKATIAYWLEAEQVPHAVPPPLESELYGDASHPLAPGYEALARQLLAEPAFQSTMSVRDTSRKRGGPYASSKRR